MKKKILITFILIIFTVAISISNVYAYDYDYATNVFGENVEHVQFNATDDPIDVFNKYTDYTWAMTLKYITLHQISYTHGGTRAPLSDSELAILDVLRKAQQEGYNLNLTPEEKAIVDSFNPGYDDVFDVITQGDDFDFNNYLNVTIDHNMPYYETAYEDRHQNTSSTPDPEKATLGDIINKANSFLSSGQSEGDKISTENLQILSGSLYNILFVIGMFAAIIMGVILGIKFVTEGVEGKAEVKKVLIPYIAGCIIVFGSFTIWKIVVTILQG